MSQNYMSIQEFRDGGWLQEVNRKFLHRAGLALSVEVDPETGEVLGFGKIIDWREDPEGMGYAESVLDTDDARAKAAQVSAEIDKHREARVAMFGAEVQPLPRSV